VKVTPTDIPDVLVVEPDVFADDRGFFMESYSKRKYAELGMAIDFVQDNHSRSVKGVVRGLHYQLSPGQTKLVRVVAGEIYDVAVDIRRASPTFGRWTGEILSAENRKQLFIPTGFAHGFSVLSDVAEVEYKVDTYYDASLERGIAYNAPELGIDWQVPSPVLSPRDQGQPSLSTADIDFAYIPPRA
jgi:dTDP-4-dehydrorhamnose 3,5-epimerase